VKHGARLKYDFRKLPAEVRERAERLVTEHRGLARKAIGLAMRKFPGLDEHEVESHVMWSLMRCALNYDPATGWRFSTYAYRSLVLAAHQIAKRQLEPRARRIPTVSYDVQSFRLRSPLAAPIDELIDAEERADEAAFVRGALMRCLTPREEMILKERVFGGKTLEEAGRLCDPPLTRERIRQIEKNIYQKLLAKLRARRAVRA
jgi:RNA polymerase sigma factor (sigma-70 family)